MKYYFYRTILIFIFLSSCVKQDDSGGLASLTQGLPACPINSVITEDCLVAPGTTVYYYDSEYGGRSPIITGPINIADNQASAVLPTGWYQGTVTLNFASSVLAPAILRDTITVFGSTGNYNSSANPACVPNGLQSTTCSASNGHFLFTQAYGGRGALCTNYDNGALNSNCWVENTGYTISNVPGGNSPACVVEGAQGAICSAAVNTYYYQDEYGGRTNDCSSGYNAVACWVPSSGKFLTANANNCVDNAFNNVTCGTNPGRYVYDDIYGGRGADCINDVNGSCYVTQASKAALEPALKAENIKMGVSIFGVVGMFAGQGDWYSTAHRSQETAPITQLAESTVFAGTTALPAGYRVITSISRDDEGGPTSTEVTPVNRAGWGNTSCGTTQATLADRINHCEAVFGINSAWDGSVLGNAGQMRWRLVTRTGNVSSQKGREVWIDSKTGLLWSSLVSKNINWCKAAGSSNNLGVNARYREDDANNICDQDVNQNNTAGSVISACFEGSGFGTDADVDPAGKAGLSITATATSPAVAWRLPTMYDYEVADAHGIRFVMPDIGNHFATEEWMATTLASDKTKAWTYTGSAGLQLNKTRNIKVMARCIGR